MRANPNDQFPKRSKVSQLPLPPEDRLHNCPNCTHRVCPECKGTGYVSESSTEKYGPSAYRYAFLSKRCPRGCPPPTVQL